MKHPKGEHQLSSDSSAPFLCTSHFVPSGNSYVSRLFRLLRETLRFLLYMPPLVFLVYTLLLLVLLVTAVVQLVAGVFRIHPIRHFGLIVPWSLLHVRSGSRLPPIALFYWLPDSGLIVAALMGFVHSPLLMWTKVIRHVVLGQHIGYARPLPTQEKNRDYISRLEVLSVNGAYHVMRFRGSLGTSRGNDDASPPPLKILLYLHGGPGMTEMLAGQDHGFRDEAMAHDFLVVDYDQRSAACSGYLNRLAEQRLELRKARGEAHLPTPPLHESKLCLNQHVDDALAICHWLKSSEEFMRLVHKDRPNLHQRKRELHLIGGSWGSILALNTAAEAPPGLLVSPVIVRGLAFDASRSEELGYNFIKEQMDRCQPGIVPPSYRERLDQLTGIPSGSFSYLGKEGCRTMLEQRKYLAAFGGESYENLRRVMDEGTFQPFWERFFTFVNNAVHTPEMPLGALLMAKENVQRTIDVFSNEVWRKGTCLPSRANSHLRHPPPLQSLQSKNMAHRTLPATEFKDSNLSIAVLQGRHDYCTASALVTEYLKDVVPLGGNKGTAKKYLCWFEKSGHAPEKEEPMAFAAVARRLWGIPPASQPLSYDVQEVQ